MMMTTVVVGVVVRCLVVRRAGECASRASIASLRARGHISFVRSFFVPEFSPEFSSLDWKRNHYFVETNVVATGGGTS